MVLLVDDQAMIGEAVRRLLSEEDDIDLHFCSQPLSAITNANQLKPTVILQDLVMPRADGLDIVRQFRSNPIIVFCKIETAVAQAAAISLWRTFNRVM